MPVNIINLSKESYFIATAKTLTNKLHKSIKLQHLSSLLSAFQQPLLSLSE